MSYIRIFPKQASRQRLLWLQEGVCVVASLFVSYIAENDTLLDYTNILSVHSLRCGVRLRVSSLLIKLD